MLHVDLHETYSSDRKAKKPCFVVLEGIDGSGKSEQAGRLAESCAELGISVRVAGTSQDRPLRRLYRTLIGQRDTFPGARTSIFLALGDFSHLIDELETSTNEDIVLLHRYIYSTLADGIALGLDREYLLAIADAFPKPDLVVYLRTDANVACGRKQSISLAEAGGPLFVDRHQADHRRSFVAYQSDVSTAYDFLLPRLVALDRLLIVEGDLPLEQIQKTLATELRRLLA